MVLQTLISRYNTNFFSKWIVKRTKDSTKGIDTISDVECTWLCKKGIPRMPCGLITSHPRWNSTPVFLVASSRAWARHRGMNGPTVHTNEIFLKFFSTVEARTGEQSSEPLGKMTYDRSVLELVGLICSKVIYNAEGRHAFRVCSLFHVKDTRGRIINGIRFYYRFRVSLNAPRPTFKIIMEFTAAGGKWTEWEANRALQEAATTRFIRAKCTRPRLCLLDGAPFRGTDRSIVY